MTVDQFIETINRLRGIFPDIGNEELLVHLPEIRPSPHTYAGIVRIIKSDSGWVMIEINQDDIMRGASFL